MIDLAVGERCEGPVFVGRDGRRRLDRHAAARIVRRVAGRAGITKVVGPHTLRHAFITAALDAGVPLRDVQEAASHADPRTTMRYDCPIARPGLPRPPRHLHHRRVRRRSRPIVPDQGWVRGSSPPRTHPSGHAVWHPTRALPSFCSPPPGLGLGWA